MKILHYALGFPPYRTGGMTKFCIDLMKQQVKEGDNVSLLWPGEMRLFNRKTVIKKCKSLNEIGSYEVINPLPVSYDEGIREFNAFKKPGDIETYALFINELCPDVIHIHTLMGLHKELLLAAKERGIKIVFSAHDFYPICPKVTMYRHGQICKSIASCAECSRCNCTALTLNKIRILQSRIYRVSKNHRLVQMLRKQHRDEYLREGDLDTGKPAGIANDYLELREYYFSLLNCMDLIHYNSNITQKVYDDYFDLPKSIVINITHADISDHRKVKKYESSVLRIRYLGPQSGAKGYYLLKESLDELWKCRKDFQLDVHFRPDEIPPYMKCHERYNYYDLESIFESSDVLICPSIWYETFGYTVLEALSYGVPVILSDTVGARDILQEGAGLVISDISSVTLFEVLQKLSFDNLEQMNQTIACSQIIPTMSSLSSEIKKMLYCL